jgi:hypothetical protein
VITATGGNTTLKSFRFRDIHGHWQLTEDDDSLSGGSAFSLSWGTTNAYNATKDLSLDRDAAGIVGITNGTTGTTAANYRDLKLRHLLAAGTAPTLTVGTGTIAGADGAGRVTLTAGSQTTITVTLGTAFATNIPVCVANNETTSVHVQAVPALGAVQFNAAFGAADKITWHCIGY